MERKFKIGDIVIPKINGRFRSQRIQGKQKIIKVSELDDTMIRRYDWVTDKGYHYCEHDIELYERKIEPKVIKEYGIAKFCKEQYV